ncbi:DUF721 domain-containing protein [Thermosediminibacter litoriperuensis]|nr:DUF721 domain-containing protein [Thermosediminibacter litoriperuensis]
MEKIRNILLKTLKKTELERRLRQAMVFVHYEEMVGEKIARISKPVFFRGDTLFIGVASPIWAHQLLFFKSDIINKINSRFSPPLVKDIRFQVCRVDGEPEGGKEDGQEDIEVEIPDKKKQMVYNITSDIKDEKLRQKFAELMMKDLEFKIKRGESLVHSHRQKHGGQDPGYNYDS